MKHVVGMTGDEEKREVGTEAGRNALWELRLNL